MTESDRQALIEEVTNYCMLVESMTPKELAHEIGKVYLDRKQAAIIMVLATRILRLENGGE